MKEISFTELKRLNVLGLIDKLFFLSQNIKKYSA